MSEPVETGALAAAVALAGRMRQAREAAAAAVAALHAEPEAVQQAVRKRLARYVEEAKVNEAGGVNAEGVAAQVAYLAEDTAAFPPDCWAAILEAARREAAKEVGAS